MAAMMSIYSVVLMPLVWSKISEEHPTHPLGLTCGAICHLTVVSLVDARTSLTSWSIASAPQRLDKKQPGMIDSTMCRTFLTVMVGTERTTPQLQEGTNGTATQGHHGFPSPLTS